MGEFAAPTLSRCVGEVERFVELNWQQAPLRRTSGESFDDVLTVQTLDLFVAGAARWPAVRLVRKGDELPRSSYCRSTRIGGKLLDDVVDPRAVGDAFLSGATVVAQSLHRHLAGVSSFATSLEEEISHPVQVNAYFSPPGSVGLAPHADSHDVIVIQLEGSKQWTVAGLGDCYLQAGDVVYIPRGCAHNASTDAEFSLHLTVGILPVTYRAVLQRVLDECESLDRALPLGYARAVAEPGLVGGLCAARSAVLAYVDSLDPTALANRERARRATRRNLAGHLGSIARIGEIDSDTMLAICEPVPRVELTDSGEVRLVTTSGAVGAPARILSAVSCLMAQRLVRVGDLPGLDNHSQLVLARRLVEEGICALPLSPGTTIETGTVSRPQRSAV